MHNDCWDSDAIDSDLLDFNSTQNGRAVYDYLDPETGEVRQIYQGTDGRYYDINDHPMDDTGAPTNIDTADIDNPEVNLQNHRSTSPIWQGFRNYRAGTKTSGTGRNKQFYEWDFEHGGEIEVYDLNGKHLGVMDPNTGQFIKPADPGRKITL